MVPRGLRCLGDSLQEEVQDGLDGGELSTQMRGKVSIFYLDVFIHPCARRF